jgi:hypothetical protein
MQIRTHLLALIAAGLVPFASAGARDLYVSNTAGDDGFTGQQPTAKPDGSGPVRTIERALRLAQQGDQIHVQNTGQPYRESLSLTGGRHSGSALAPFVLSGNGAVLDGTAPVPPGRWENYRMAVFRFMPPRMEFQQLFLGGRPAARVAASAASAEPPKLDPLQWCLHRGSIYFAVEPQRLPGAYPLRYAAKPAGISLLAVHDVLIREFVVEGFHLDGINALNRCRAVRLLGVTCRANGRSGVAVGGASLVDLDSCRLSGNGYAQLLTLPLSETHIRQSELRSDTAPAWIDQGGKVLRDGREIRGGLDQFQPGPAGAGAKSK